MKNFTVLILLFIGYSANSQVGIGIPNPDASAVLELASTRKGFLPPRLSTTERDAISQPAEGLTIYNTTKNCLEWYLVTGWYNACGDNGVAVVDNYSCRTRTSGTMTAGDPVSGVSQTITAKVTVPGSYDISATQNGVTFSATGTFTSIGNHDVVLHATGKPIVAGNHDFDLNTSPNSCSFRRTTLVKILTVTGRAGKIWMAHNLGATAVPRSSTDAAQYGDYYQWGRNTDGHEKLNSPLTNNKSSQDRPGHNRFITAATYYEDWRSPSNSNLWQGYSGNNNPCPAGFRVPTNKEWEDEFKAAKITNAATAYNSSLRLTVSGYRNNGGTYSDVGSSGYYWSRRGSNGIQSVITYFDSGSSSTSSSFYKVLGLNVRCIQN